MESIREQAVVGLLTASKKCFSAAQPYHRRVFSIYTFHFSVLYLGSSQGVFCIRYTLCMVRSLLFWCRRYLHRCHCILKCTPFFFYLSGHGIPGQSRTWPGLSLDDRQHAGSWNSFFVGGIERPLRPPLLPFDHFLSLSVQRARKKRWSRTGGSLLSEIKDECFKTNTLYF